MDQKNSLIYDIPKKVYEEVEKYCKLNKIENISDFMFQCFRQGFDIKKYGLLGEDSGKIGGTQEKQVEIEVIREKRVEVPVEVIKEVIVEKEIPIEIIKEKIVEKIVEVPVEKIVKVSDNTQINELLLKIQQLEFLIQEKTQLNESLQNELNQKLKQNNNEEKTKLLQETLQKLRKQNIDLENQVKELKEKLKNITLFDNNGKVVYHNGSDINKDLIK